MTKKELQQFTNTICLENYEEMMKEFMYSTNKFNLRTCNAKVYETPSYYVLRSYNTIVAFICKETDTLYDVLRYVYGYTSTSAQHISKFEKDYCAGKWNCKMRLTYRAV